MATEIAYGQFDGSVTTQSNLNMDFRTNDGVFDGTELLLMKESNAKIWYTKSITYDQITGKTTTTYGGKFIYSNDLLRIGKKPIFKSKFLFILKDSLDWTNTKVKAPTTWDKLHIGCDADNTKPAIISNKIQLKKIQDKLRNFNNYVWLGLRLTSEGIRFVFSMKTISKNIIFRIRRI